MSSTAPRGWPGVTVPADYYDGEVFSSSPTTPSTSAQPTALPTHTATRHRPRLVAVWLGLAAVLILLLLLQDPLPLVRLLVTAALLINGSLMRQQVVIADAGATLLVHRRSSSEPQPPATVTAEHIVRVRPRSTHPIGRYFRPEVWQVGPERIIVGSDSLRELLGHQAQETQPS